MRKESAIEVDDFGRPMSAKPGSIKKEEREEEGERIKRMRVGERQSALECTRIIRRAV